MDAREFLAEHQRMCRSFGINCNTDSSVCPAYSNGCCTYKGREFDENIVDIVEHWSKEHGGQTNYDKFKEVFPNVPSKLDVQYNLVIDTNKLDYGFWNTCYYREDDKHT